MKVNLSPPHVEGKHVLLPDEIINLIFGVYDGPKHALRLVNREYARKFARSVWWNGAVDYHLSLLENMPEWQRRREVNLWVPRRVTTVQTYCKSNHSFWRTHLAAKEMAEFTMSMCGDDLSLWKRWGSELPHKPKKNAYQLQKLRVFHTPASNPSSFSIVAVDFKDTRSEL